MSDEKFFEGGQEVQSNWMKFTNVGDKVKGTLVGRKVQPGSEGFSDQLVCQLRGEDGIVNVGISVNKTGTVDRLQSCKLGEIVGIVFDSEGEPPKKGFHPIKNLKVYTFGLDESYEPAEAGKEVSVDDIPF